MKAFVKKEIDIDENNHNLCGMECWGFPVSNLSDPSCFLFDEQRENTRKDGNGDWKRLAICKRQTVRR